MSAEIKPYPGVSVPELSLEEQPVAAIISVLQELLQESIEGRIRSIAFAIVTAGNHTTHTWANGHGQTAHTQSAAIHDLAFAYDHQRYQQAYEGKDFG